MSRLTAIMIIVKFTMIQKITATTALPTARKELANQIPKIASANNAKKESASMSACAKSASANNAKKESASMSASAKSASANNAKKELATSLAAKKPK